MLSPPQTKPLGQLLIHRGILQPAQLELALDEQRRTERQKLLGEILIEQKWCSPEQVSEALALSYGVPFVRLTPRLADPKVIQLLPRPFIERNVVLPLFKVEGVLTVAVPEPADVFLPEEIERVSGCRVQIVAATAADIRSTLHAYLPGDRTFAAGQSAAEVGPQQFALAAEPARPCANRAAADPAVVRLVRTTICSAAQESASEIHIDPPPHGSSAGEFRIRFRIDGRLTDSQRPQASLFAPLLYRLKWLADIDPSASNRPQDGLIRLLIEGRPVRAALSTVPTLAGETAVLRITQPDRAPLHLEKLGFAYETFKQWRKLLTLPCGLVVVTGPAASGKRTTLYASLREMNSADLKVCTVEDSPELHLPGVHQLRPDPAAGFGFPQAVAAILHHHPDVLMVSDVRDAQTARLAVQAALDGKLVLAGLCAPDAASAVSWLLSLGVEPFLLAATLSGVLAQRLVRKLCSACKEPAAPTAAERRQFDRHIGSVESIFRPRGCPRCRSVGYLGRLGLHELLVTDDAFRGRLGQAAPLSELRDLARASRMKTLRTDGMEKVKAGITTLDELFRVNA